jgi:ribulose-phosphate 3-epimerase
MQGEYLAMALISPCLGAFNLARLGEGLEIIRQAGAGMVHLDVSDGHFVPDVAFGLPVVGAVRKATGLALDVHLLIERPERFVADFAKAGASRIAIHPEATADLYGTLRLIRSHGALAGAALLAGTPLESVADAVAVLDFVALLSAEPGAAEETYIPHVTSKVRIAFDLRRRCAAEYSVHVEGAVDLERLEEVVRAGADVVVPGTAWVRQPSPQASLAEFIHRASTMSADLERAGNPFRES